MPAWMTSLLRELVPVPKVGADSSTKTSLPLSASSLATAIPTTPAPITTQSTFSLGAELEIPLLKIVELELVAVKFASGYCVPRQFLLLKRFRITVVSDLGNILLFILLFSLLLAGQIVANCS